MSNSALHLNGQATVLEGQRGSTKGILQKSKSKLRKR